MSEYGYLLFMSTSEIILRKFLLTGGAYLLASAHVLTLYCGYITRGMTMAMPHSALCNRYAWYYGCTVRCGIEAFPLTSSDRLFWPSAGNIRFTSVSEGSSMSAGNMN